MKRLSVARALRSSRALMLLLSSLAALGCGPDFDPASLVTRPRIVGARLITSAPPRAWPMPGETVRIEWFVLTPTGERPLLSAVVGVCLPEPLRNGPPTCADGTFNALPFRPSSDEPFVSELSVPAAVGGADSLFVVGAVCFDGLEPNVNASVEFQDLTCGPDRGRAETLILTIPLALDSNQPANNHPVVDDWTWTLVAPDAASMSSRRIEWTAPTDSIPSECAPQSETSALPHVSLGSSTSSSDWTIEIVPNPNEEYREEAGSADGTTTRETIQISHFSTAGELARVFSAIPVIDTVDNRLTVGWTTPRAEKVPPGGLVVHFAIVARDGRGGFALAERALCVTP